MLAVVLCGMILRLGVTCQINAKYYKDLVFIGQIDLLLFHRGVMAQLKEKGGPRMHSKRTALLSAERVCQRWPPVNFVRYPLLLPLIMTCPVVLKI